VVSVLFDVYLCVFLFLSLPFIIVMSDWKEDRNASYDR
jgi:hypothetical protein